MTEFYQAFKEIGNRRRGGDSRMKSKQEIKEKLTLMRQKSEEFPEGHQQRIMLSGYRLALMWVLYE